MSAIKKLKMKSSHKKYVSFYTQRRIKTFKKNLTFHPIYSLLNTIEALQKHAKISKKFYVQAKIGEVAMGYKIKGRKYVFYEL